MDEGGASYRRFLSGDEYGIAEIIRDYKDGLMLYINNFVDNIFIAEDLTEETFVKIVVKKPHFSGKSSFKTWLYAIGRNIALDHIRHQKKYIPFSPERFALLQREEENVERLYLQTERNLQLHCAIKRLHTPYRTALYLAFFEQFCNDEIAKVMGKNKKQVENLLYRAKESLKAELEKEGVAYEVL